MFCVYDYVLCVTNHGFPASLYAESCHGSSSIYQAHRLIGEI